jgi:phenylalanyl-tRNA synthetase beta chain
MKVSLNTVKKYTAVDLPVDKLVAKINEQLGGVEEVIDLGKRYEGAVIVKVVNCDDHPNADRLHVCKVDDGGAVPNMPRDESGLVQVVCGAPNVHADMLAVWLPPGSTVPESYDKDPFVLEARDLRGVVSNGMLASPKELSFGDSHEGILEIDASEWKPNDIEIKPGAKFAEVYELNDYIIDIENKMFTHRPDLFGQLGVAREIAGIQHQRFTSPEWYLKMPEFHDASGLQLEVFNDAGDNAPRFMAVAIKDVAIKPSPVWLQAELVRLGAKPINNIVDVTNYVMLLTAQPTHAYDYDKLRGGKLGARMASSGEKVTLLNHKTYELTTDDIVIADGEGPVGLAGIMGGGNSEVSADTKSIVLEVANFDMYTVRKSSMRHGVFTDALSRFNKGQSPLQNPHVLSLLMMSVNDVAGGEQASQVYDKGRTLNPLKTVQVGTRFIGERLGIQPEFEEDKSILENVEMKVKLVDTQQQRTIDTLGTIKFNENLHTVDELLDVSIPFWRTDIELPEDIVEEVGRLYGFDKLPRDLPKRSVAPAAKNPVLELNWRIRESLRRAGANEVLTYSFVHENLMKKAGQDPAQAFRLSNALSPDLQYYRLSILPSLLDKVRPNIKAGHDEFLLYEIGKGHHKSNVDDAGLPAEPGLLEAVYASKQPKDGAAYFCLRREFDTLLHNLNITPTYQKIEKPLDFAGMAPFDQARSSLVVASDGTMLGVIGELKTEIINNFKLPAYVAGAAFDLAGLLKAAGNAGGAYEPLSRFPSVTQDITLKSSANFAELSACLTSALNEAAPESTTVHVTPLSIFQKADSTDTTQTSFRIVVTSHLKTLREAEVTGLLDTAAAVCKDRLSAERI